MTGRTLIHYQILDKLGEGGMGVVYRARDTRLDRLVALKFLPPERMSDPDRKRRFIREARAASALNHPNIITVHDIDQADGMDFIAMEYVDGRTLAQAIAAGPMPVKEALGYAVQIADALAAAHRAGIVHRDLKPGNVMVTEDGRVKVLDFGLAKLAEPALESTLTLVAGTAAYMAPEQAEGRPVDARTDLYSFGAVLYEMLSGRRAFAGIGREEPAPLKDAPDGLRRIVARCLRRDPAERFQSAAELKAALEQAAQGPQAAPSVAVLPFANLSADNENEYFSDGLAEEIINALTQVPGLRVASRTSSFYFRGKDLEISEIAARLKVGHILEGSVRKAGDRIRVTAQLVNAADGYHLWSERFDRRLTDVFDIQDEIARAIVDRLRVQLSADRTLAGRPTARPEAYCLYLKGRHWWGMFTGEGWRESVRCFKAAIAEDPGYALPYAGVAVSHVYQAATGWARPGDVMPAAKQSALKALALDETLADAHWAVAMVSHWHEWDWDGAEIAFRKALAQNPRDGLIRIHYGGALMNRGRRNEGLAEARQALEMEPISMEVNRQMIYLYCLAEQSDLAIEQGRRTLELHPQFVGAYLNLGLAYVFSERYPEAVETFRTAAAMVGGDKFYGWGLALAYARSGRGKEAREVLDRLERTAYSPLLLAAIYGELGERDRAFGLLTEAYEVRDGLMASLGVEPSFAAIRTDPRCGELLKRMRLTC